MDGLHALELCTKYCVIPFSGNGVYSFHQTLKKCQSKPKKLVTSLTESMATHPWPRATPLLRISFWISLLQTGKGVENGSEARSRVSHWLAGPSSPFISLGRMSLFSKLLVLIGKCTVQEKEALWEPWPDEQFQILWAAFCGVWVPSVGSDQREACSSELEKSRCLRAKLSFSSHRSVTQTHRQGSGIPTLRLHHGPSLHLIPTQQPWTPGDVKVNLEEEEMSQKNCSRDGPQAGLSSGDLGFRKSVG